jgi:hypothetical protein
LKESTWAWRCHRHREPDRIGNGAKVGQQDRGEDRRDNGTTKRYFAVACSS